MSFKKFDRLRGMWLAEWLQLGICENQSRWNICSNHLLAAMNAYGVNFFSAVNAHGSTEL